MYLPPGAGRGFIEQLNRELAERRSVRAAQTPAQQNPLAVRSDQWYRSLSALERAPHYTMKQLVAVFDALPRGIEPALFELGWTRKRSWASTAPYSRIWSPPAVDHGGST